MKRLAKILALVLLVVVIFGVGKTIQGVFAAEQYGKIKVSNCEEIPDAINCKRVNAQSDPDINVKLRGFGRLNSSIGDERLRLVKTCAAELDPELTEPRMCGLFKDKRTPAFTSLFAVGKLDLSNNPEAVPPHLLGMQTAPGEAITVPGTAGKFVQEPYVAMVLFADANSITLKYTDFDDYQDPGGSYEINIVGIRPNPDLLSYYTALNKGGGATKPREYLPGVKEGQPIGNAIGSEIWVTMRDTGSFMDPRWRESWWRDECDKPNAKATLTNDEILKNHPANETQLKGINSKENTPVHTSQSGTDDCPVPPDGGIRGGPGREGLEKENLGAKFPPLHTLQACPPEIPTVGEFQNSQNPSTGKYCIDPLPEPVECQDPSLVGTSRHLTADQFCRHEGEIDGHSVDGIIRTCYPESKETYLKNNTGPDDHQKFLCGGDRSISAPTYGILIDYFCKGIDNGGPLTPDSGAGYRIHQAVLKCSQGQDPGDIMGSDPHILRMCMGYFDSLKKKTPAPVNNGSKQLPACVPTKNGNVRCVTECSSPIEVKEDYLLTNGPIKIAAPEKCLNTQDCVLKMKLADPKISLPFTKDLADYFGGTLDAGGVANGDLTEDDLKEIKAAVADGDVTQSENYEKLQQAFQMSGVARKLLPAEIQDQLRCQFINYVKQKITSKQNTKYYYKKNGQPEVFKIGGVAVTNIVPPPTINPETCAITRPDSERASSWPTNPQGGKVWSDVPLFTDDDAQGQIQFVSPSLYSSNKPGEDQNVPIGPIYISVPDIQRLGSAVNVIQKALVPEKVIADQEKQIVDKAYPEAIGKTVQIIKATERVAAGLEVNSCRPIAEGTKSWEPYYKSDLMKSYEKAWTDPANTQSEYSRGVLCKVEPVSGEGGSNICVVGPEGQLFCYREEKVANPPRTGKNYNNNQVVQVRTVIPYLFDLAEQAISPATGLLRIFKPEYLKQQGNSSLEARDEFEKPFEPLPAQSDPVKYELTGGYASIDEGSELNKDWRIFFYKLGGVWTARNFVLDLLDPNRPGETKAGAK